MPYTLEDFRHKTYTRELYVKFGFLNLFVLSHIGVYEWLIVPT